MSDTFFEEGATKEAPNEPSKVKVGEKEYSQEELSQLVGLGETAREIETKQNTKLDRVFPEFTKSRQEVKELRDELDEFRKTQERLKVAVTGEEERPDPEALKAQAIEQAKALGLLTADEARQIAREERQAERILEEIETLNSEAEETGKPKVDGKDLLEYMQQEGLRSPSVAYKLKYESELETWKQNKLDGIKQPGLDTQTSSTAGSKEPPTEKERLTKSNFGERLTSFIDLREGKGNQ